MRQAIIPSEEQGKANSLLLHHRSKQEQNPTINAALGVFQTK